MIDKFNKSYYYKFEDTIPIWVKWLNLYFVNANRFIDTLNDHRGQGFNIHFIRELLKRHMANKNFAAVCDALESCGDIDRHTYRVILFDSERT